MPQNKKTSGKPNKGRFKPGQSGNPGGRPKSNAIVQEMARAHTEDAINALIKVIKTSKSESSVVRAAEIILNRGWGTPTQAIELSTPEAIRIEWPK